MEATIAKPKRVKTILGLKEHLKKYKDAILIVGEGCYEGDNIEIDPDMYNRKMLKRESVAFWKYFKEIINIDRDMEIEPFLNILKDMGLVKEVYNQSIFGGTKSVNMKGCIEDYTCDKCSTYYSSNSINFDSDDLNECEVCGNKIRPSVLLRNEKYSQDIIDKLADDLNDTHTVFMIGLDYSEPIMNNYLGKYGALKEFFNESIEDQKIAISVGESEIDPNEILFCEFKVGGEIKDSMKRLISGIR